MRELSSIFCKKLLPFRKTSYFREKARREAQKAKEAAAKAKRKR